MYIPIFTHLFCYYEYKLFYLKVNKRARANEKIIGSKISMIFFSIMLYYKHSKNGKVWEEKRMEMSYNEFFLKNPINDCKRKYIISESNGYWIERGFFDGKFNIFSKIKFVFIGNKDCLFSKIGIFQDSTYDVILNEEDKHINLYTDIEKELFEYAESVIIISNKNNKIIFQKTHSNYSELF